MNFPDLSIYAGLDYPSTPGSDAGYPRGLDDNVARATECALERFRGHPRDLHAAIGRIVGDFPVGKFKLVCDHRGFTDPLREALFPFVAEELTEHGVDLATFSPTVTLDTLNEEGQWRLAVHDAKHQETTRHGTDASAIVVAVGWAYQNELAQFDGYSDRARDIFPPAFLHDHGKSDLPNSILGNPFDAGTHLPHLFQDNLRDPHRKQRVFIACLTPAELEYFEPVLKAQNGALWREDLLQELMLLLNQRRYRFGDGIPSRFILKVMRRIDAEGRFQANGQDLQIRPVHLNALARSQVSLPYTEAVFAAHAHVTGDLHGWKTTFMDAIRRHVSAASFSLSGVIDGIGLEAVEGHHDYQEQGYPDVSLPLGQHIQVLRTGDIVSALAPHSKQRETAVRCYQSAPRSAFDTSKIFGFEAQRGLIHPDCERVTRSILDEVQTPPGHVLSGFVDEVVRRYGMPPALTQV